MSVRLRRLQAEYERLVTLFADHERIRIVEAIGSPPDKYVIEYRVRGRVEENGELKDQDLHRAQISLGPNYPRERPRCVMLTPVFHPNIDHLAICTEDIGSAGQTLDQTIVFIGEMIAYQAFNLQSPRNGDAARWAAEHLDELPLEGIDLVSQVLTHGMTGAELPFAAPSWAQANSSLEPQTEPMGVAIPQAVPITQMSMYCANCGLSSASNELRPCANEHTVCADCLLACQNCPEMFCVLCDMQRCAGCQALFCSDCVMLCESCQSLACLTHIRQCQVCRHWQCLVSCARFCESCGSLCCREHLDAANYCSGCASAGSNVSVETEVITMKPLGPE